MSEREFLIELRCHVIAFASAEPDRAKRRAILGMAAAIEKRLGSVIHAEQGQQNQEAAGDTQEAVEGRATDTEAAALVIPDERAPISGDDAVAQRTSDHAAMPAIRA